MTDDRREALFDACIAGRQPAAPAVSEPPLKFADIPMRLDPSMAPNEFRLEQRCGCAVTSLPDGSTDQIWCAEHSKVRPSAAPVSEEFARLPDKWRDSASVSSIRLKSEVLRKCADELDTFLSVRERGHDQ